MRVWGCARRLFAPALCLLAAALSLSAQKPPVKNIPVRETPIQESSGQEAGTKEANASGSRILAEHIVQEGNEVTARGRVRVFYRDMILMADYVKLNTQTKDALAEGHVNLQLPKETISAEIMAVNMDTALGRFEDAFGMAQPSLIYSSDKIERVSEDYYQLAKSRFTACSQAVPRWGFACSRANMMKDRYIEMWGATFSIKKIPVFYFPYIKYPLAEERATGFLIPMIGYSGIKGISISQSFYWAISRNQDATFTYDMYGAKGMGGGVEYRYMFGSPQSEGGRGLYSGQAQVYYFTFKSLEDGSKPDPAYIVRWNHNQVLPGGFSLTADVDYQTSFDFLREFDNNFKRAVVSNRRSQVYLSRTWGPLSFSARASQFETYFQSIDNAIVSKSLPQLSLTLSRTKVLGPVYFSMTSSYSNWQYGWRTMYEAGTQLQNQTISLVPVLSLPWAALPWLTLDTSLTGNLHYFFNSRDTATDTIIDEPYLAANYAIEISAVGPVFYKIYNIGKPVADPLKQPKLKHLIEPTVSYRYEPSWADPDRIVAQRPFYRSHMLVYGLTNRFFYKSTGAAKEILTLGVSQTYYLSPDESNLSRFVIMDPEIPEGIHPSFSDINGYVRFYPAEKISLDFASRYNVYKNAFAQNRLSLTWGLPQDDYFFRLSWYMSVNPWREAYYGNRHQVSAGGGIKLPRLNLDAIAEIDYNVLEKKLLYVAGSVVYHYQCIDFRLESRIYYFREEPEFQIRFSFDLAGVGKSNDFLSGSRYD